MTSRSITVKVMVPDVRCAVDSVRITQAPPLRLSACSLERAAEAAGAVVDAARS